MNANLQDQSDAGCGCTELQADAACSEHGVVSLLRSLLVDEGPTVEVKSGSEEVSVEVIPPGTAQGGVWPNEHTQPHTWGWTCQACAAWQTHYQGREQAYAALRVHQRHNCEARKDGQS